jgi:hypothetical protein
MSRATGTAIDLVLRSVRTLLEVEAAKPTTNNEGRERLIQREMEIDAFLAGRAQQARGRKRRAPPEDPTF